MTVHLFLISYLMVMYFGVLPVIVTAAVKYALDRSYRSTKVYHQAGFGPVIKKFAPLSITHLTTFIPITWYQLNAHEKDILPQESLIYINTGFIMFSLYFLALRGIELIVNPKSDEAPIVTKQNGDNDDAPSTDSHQESDDSPDDSGDDTEESESEEIISWYVPEQEPDEFMILLINLIKCAVLAVEAMGFFIVAMLKMSETAWDISDSNMIILAMCINIAILATLLLVHKFVADPSGALVTVSKAHTMEILVLSLSTATFKTVISWGVISDDLFSVVIFVCILYNVLLACEEQFMQHCQKGVGAHVIREKEKTE